MSYFSVGNLLTLGIMILAFALYHQLTRRNSTLDKIREYGKRLKGELDDFVEQREAAVRDYAVDLEVKQSAARALLERLVHTDEDLKGKAEAIARIDERISHYDSSLEELVRMTARVQENLDRVRDEGSFVENALKRIAQAETRLKGVEEDLGETRDRFERESADSMERISREALDSVKAAVSDLQAAVETIERRVEDHREAVIQVEKQREENLERDMALINDTLRKAVLRAGERADKLEDETLGKLREQAAERIKHFRDALEEKLKAYQEDSKARVSEVQDSIRDIKDFWKKEREEFVVEHRVLKDGLRKDIDELQLLSRDQKESWKEAAEEAVSRNRERFAALEAAFAETETRSREQIAFLEKAAAESGIRAREQLASLEAAAAETAARITREIAEHDDAIAAQTAEREAAFTAKMAEQDRVFAETIGVMESRTVGIQDQISRTADEIEQKLGNALSEAEARAAARANDELAKWEQAAAEAARKFAGEADELEARVAAAREGIGRDAAGIEARLSEALSEAAARADDELAKWEQAAAEAARKFAGETGELEARVAEAREGIGRDAAGIEARLSEALSEAEARAVARANDELAKWEEAAAAKAAAIRQLLDSLNKTASDSERLIAEWEAAAAGKADDSRRLFADWDAAINAISSRTEQLLSDWENNAAEKTQRVDKNIAEQLARQEQAVAGQLERQLAEAVEETGSRAKALIGEELEKWRLSLIEMEEKAEKLISGWNDSAEKAGKLAAETGAKVETLFAQTLKTAADEAKTAAAEEASRVDELLAALDGKLRAFEKETGETVAALQEKLMNTAAETGRKVQEETDARLEEYRAAQARQYESLDSLAEDSARLDGELRRYMQETEARVRQDFALFEETSNSEREAAAASFNRAAQSLRKELEDLEKDMEILKAKSRDDVSKQLGVFEADFTAGLARRGELIEEQLEEWKSKFDLSLSSLKEDFGAQRQQLELNFSEEMRERLQEQRDRLTSGLEHLKAETAAFGESIRNEMTQSGETLNAFKEQLEGDLADARAAADSQVKSELGRFSLSAAENLKQAQRDLSSSLKQIAGQAEERGAELSALQEASRAEIENWKDKLASRIKDTDSAMEEMRRRARELVAENEERLTAVRTVIEDARNEADAFKTEMLSRVDADVRQLNAAIAAADRRIQDFIAQTKLFEQADTLKQNLEQRIEDLRGDIDGLDQRRAEAAELETQFAKIKRLEDEVNAKMTRFLSEQRRIELMEADFNRLLRTSQAVETKLTEVTASDDTLQAIQVQIRKFNDALAETEEKFQHIEKKSQTLETINQNVDRNFNTLKQTEAELKQLTGDIKARQAEQEAIRLSIEKLTADSEKAQAAADKLTLLDTDLAGIEGRIKEMQKAREWIARAETRLEELNKEIQNQVKLIGNVLREEGNAPGQSKGAPTVSTRENVIKLARQGWKVDEIAKAVKLSRGEVELILDMNAGSRG
jgi:DNA repair exonuclease SbcCD ATPase subunit